MLPVNGAPHKPFNPFHSKLYQHALATASGADSGIGARMSIKIEICLNGVDSAVAAEKAA